MANDNSTKSLNAVADAYRSMLTQQQQPDSVVVETKAVSATPAGVTPRSSKTVLQQINHVAQAYRNMQDPKPVLTEETDDEIVIPEEITKEDASDFTVAASAAKKAGKKTFKFGGKEFPVTIKTDIKTESSKVVINPEEKDKAV